MEFKEVAMTENKGQALVNLYQRMKKYPGCVKRAAEIAGVTTQWVRVIVRDLKYENERIIEASIEALREFEERDRGENKVSEDYISRMTELITKKLNDEQSAPSARPEQTDRARRHSAVAG